MTNPNEKEWEEVEALSATLHDIYQKEAHRQEDAGIGKARHYDEYAKLSEPVKEFDRVLARFLRKEIAAAEWRGKEAEAIAHTEEDMDSYKAGQRDLLEKVKERINSSLNAVEKTGLFIKPFADGHNAALKSLLASLEELTKEI